MIVEMTFFILIGIVILGFGVLMMRKPSFGWRANEGWKVEGDSEPSDAYLVTAQIRGLVMIVLGAFLVLMGILKIALA
ncbi:hypothetical protein RJP21_26825 [Paenibacillus sp. VCA1]|uniref:DUF6199 family natural product biosynthesis protein n=1 Tax=Paenibacillus sp. VCA1 TaxID=3039148 RepID=UPI0028717FAF|nr:DUF6199 family natural product biosynthesis protein [Paenibacillus sp. VCA1]MDR9857216.1 hypothetical protein [Paenibacillus sp. VCA1]